MVLFDHPCLFFLTPWHKFFTLTKLQKKTSQKIQANGKLKCLCLIQQTSREINLLRTVYDLFEVNLDFLSDLAHTCFCFSLDSQQKRSWLQTS